MDSNKDKKINIEVCVGKACKSRFSQYILDRLENDKAKLGMKNVTIGPCPCTGNCKSGPSVIVDGEVKTRMNPLKAAEILVPPKKKKKPYKKK